MTTKEEKSNKVLILEDLLGFGITALLEDNPTEDYYYGSAYAALNNFVTLQFEEMGYKVENNKVDSDYFLGSTAIEGLEYFLNTILPRYK